MCEKETLELEDVMHQNNKLMKKTDFTEGLRIDCLKAEGKITG